MRFTELMQPQSVIDIAKQAQCNASAEFEDFFTATVERIVKELSIPIPPDLYAMFKDLVLIGFNTGAETGAYEAVELFTNELLKSLDTERKRGC